MYWALLGALEESVPIDDLRAQRGEGLLPAPGGDGPRHSDGWYYIVDRVEDLLMRGGFNVYPRIVELVDALPMTSTERSSSLSSPDARGA
jgi:hypothetical protein